MPARGTIETQYMNINNFLIDFVAGFESASNLSDCFTVLGESVEALGFTGLVYSLIPIGLNKLTNDNPVFLASPNFSSSFLDHYLNENFAADDFTIKRILKGDLSTIDWWSEEQKGTLSTAEKLVIQVAKFDYNIRNGISIPTLSTPQCIAGASVISDAPPPRNALDDERLQLLKTIIKLFHDRVRGKLEYRNTFYTPLLNQLSDREKRVLQFTLRGQAYKAIDANYKISASAASNVRSDLFKMFEVRNVSELAYIAGLHNLLEML